MPSESLRSWLGWIGRASLCAVVLLAAGYVVVWRWLGTSAAAWARLRGEAVAVQPATIDLGACRVGDVKELELRVINVSSSRVTLTGMYTSCSCLLATSLPMVLDAREESTLRLTIHASGKRGDFERRAVLYTDSSASPQLPIVVVGRMLEGERPTDLQPIPQASRAAGRRQVGEVAARVTSASFTLHGPSHQGRGVF